MENARLNRLLHLFNAGNTSPGLKRSVGKQISQLVQNDAEALLYPCLRSILPGLFSQDSDQRGSVAYCLSLLFSDDDDEPASDRSSATEVLDLERECEEREALLGSRGNEYEVSQKVDVKQQKQAVTSALSIAPGLDGLSEGLVEEKDFLSTPDSPISSDSLSVRQKAMMKRKAKQQEMNSQRVRLECISLDSLKDGTAIELKGQVQQAIKEALLNANWYCRHGALLGIRAVCGTEWLENLLLLLALDNFVDFNGGDSASAPVREEASLILYEHLQGQTKETVRAILDKFTFMLRTDATWNQNLTAYLVLSKCLCLLEVVPEEYTRMIKKIIEEADDEEMVNNALSLMQHLQNDAKDDALAGRLIKMLPECDDLSLAPAHIFSLLQARTGSTDFIVSTDLVVPFLRHKLSRVRMAAVDYLKRVDKLSDFLSQQLFQLLLFEDDDDIAHSAQQVFKNKTAAGDGCWIRWIKILSVPLDKPLPLEHLYEFKLKQTGELEVVPKSVPEWELGVKAADIMLLSPATLWTRRHRAAQVLQIPTDKQSSVSASLNKSPHGYHKLLAYWLALPLTIDPNMSLIECNDQPSNVRERWALRLRAASGAMQVEEYGRLLEVEDIPVLREDFAQHCACLIDAEPAKIRLLLNGSAAMHVCKYLKQPMQVYQEVKGDLAQANCFLRALPCKIELCDDSRGELFKRAMGEQNHMLVAVLVQKYAIGTELFDFMPVFQSSPSFFLSLMCELVKLEEIEHVVNILPAFIPLALKLMSEDERAAPLFASLMRLAPLVQASNNPQLQQGLGDNSHVQQGLRFIKGLSDPASIVQDVQIPKQLGNVQLRHYQEEGYRWLIFLQQSGLHGALCDDMGLGKTLQTLCAIVHKHQQSNKVTSMIVCPSSLTGHWQREAQTYFPHLSCTLYIGKDRASLLKNCGDLLISSYEVVRNDIDVLKSVKLAYVVLDEGHVIRNAKSKLSQAVRQLRAEHRLILTGTPIQNNILELWTLFDFLMPGYLGRDQKAFIDRYARPIMAVSAATSTVKDFEAAEEKLKVLHRQVLPFILRRMKEEVLKELPPKIVQDYYCEMTGEQRQVMLQLEGAFEKEDGGGKDGVLQAIHKMQLASVHPKLPESGADLLEYRESPKMLMLRDIIVECGYTSKSVSEDVADVIREEDNNRVLVFAQHLSVLDLVERMLKEEFDLKYLRLDGQVPSEQRADLAHKFNQDPAYALCLLTTSVGGLGLNLTGADTVVFLQHDWNPQRDLQAMDRAHRLGQKRTVNVYRLITRGSVEERVMGLQAWKLRVARTVVTQDNASITDMARMSDITDLLVAAPSAALPNNEDKTEGDKELEMGLSKLERMLLELDK